MVRGRLRSAIVGGEVDVALLHGPFDDERIETTPLFTEGRALVLSASDPRADATELSVPDLPDVVFSVCRRHGDVRPHVQQFRAMSVAATA